jgi:integrase
LEDFCLSPRAAHPLHGAPGARRQVGRKAVSRRLGHANLTTTLSIYQTVFPEDDRALADMVGDMLKGRT